ncbi:MAG: response regulator [Lachnospiraceae bacterium]|nr:response regulator [Lachnospiraceae bacterium]
MKGKGYDMLKVLIADDESMICSLISQLIDWNELGFEIVGIAHTGIDAFELIQEHKPNVIISDIRMPGYDGIELIKRTVESGINSEFIMISGFKQFEYAQKAMKFGVKYYLLKPIEEDKLREIVLEIKEGIVEKHKDSIYKNKLEIEVKATKDKMKKRFLTSMLFSNQNGMEMDLEDVNNINLEYSTEFQDGVYQAIFIKLDTNEEIEVNINSLIDEIDKYIAELGESCKEYITSSSHSGIITLLNYSENQKDEIEQQIEDLYTNIKNYIEYFKGFSVVIGVGAKTSDFFQTSTCLKTAIDAVKYRIKYRDVPIIYFDKYEFDSYDINLFITPSKRQGFIANVECEDYEQAEQYVMDEIRVIRSNTEKHSPVLLFDYIVIYASVFMEYCEKKEITDEKLVERYKQWNMLVDNARSEVTLIGITKKFFHETLEYISTVKREKDIKPVRKVKEYIEANYMEEISLIQLAELVNMNSSYLSSVFKKETGMLYSEYLTFCRMEQAKKMLAESADSIAEVAEKAGYQDSRYFSKQFAKQVGLKPSEYRKLYS